MSNPNPAPPGPVEQHRAALAGLDLTLDALDQVEKFVDEQVGNDVYAVITVLAQLGDGDIRRGLEGRKHILLRHAPVINRHDRANCAGCGKPWVDCPDWRDAAGVSEETE